MGTNLFYSLFSKLSHLRLFQSERRPRVLCYVNHYFGPSQSFRGKSTTQDPAIRTTYVRKVVEVLRRIPEATVLVCGIPQRSLVPLDIEFGGLEDTCHLVYASIEKMADELGKWDYFINIEDDILLEPAVFSEILEFDRTALITECLLPNRIERKDGEVYCVDLKATPGWTEQYKRYKQNLLRVAVSPHSGLFVLSEAKFRYACERVDLSRRDLIIGGAMASAYANIHSPFSLYRPFEPQDFLTVIHQDNWEDPIA